MRFTLIIDSENDGLQYPEDLTPVLHKLADKVEDWGSGRSNVQDVNGNTVGEWALSMDGAPAYDHALELRREAGARARDVVVTFDGSELHQLIHEVADLAVNGAGYAEDPAEADALSDERATLENRLRVLVNEAGR